MRTPTDGPANDFGGPWAESAEWAFRFLFLLVGLIAIGWIFSGIHRIPADSQAVVFRFGNAVRTQGPGLLLAWPAPIERVAVLPSPARQIEFQLPRLADSETAYAVITGAYVSYDPRANTAILLTGDFSVIHLQATLFYQIVDPVAYVICGKHVGPALQRLFLASAVATIGGRDLDSVMVARPETATQPAEVALRERLRSDLASAVNGRLAELAQQHVGLGIQVSRVDLSASIPSGAKTAFDHVLTVTQEAQRNIALARTKAVLATQAARQESERIATDAAASAAESVNDARARTATIGALGFYSQDSSHTMLLQRLYYQRIGRLFRRIGHIETVDRDGSVHEILPGTTQP